MDGISDQALLSILAASRHCAQVGLTAGLRHKRVRAIDLLRDRVAPLLGSSAVIAWTVQTAYAESQARLCLDAEPAGLGRWQHQYQLVPQGANASIAEPDLMNAEGSWNFEAGEEDISEFLWQLQGRTPTERSALEKPRRN